MPSLTSCYFCGEAVGASLAEYAIPDDAPTDEQVSLTLCAQCQGKLSALLEELPQHGDLPADAPEESAGDATDTDDTPGTNPVDDPGANDEAGRDRAAEALTPASEDLTATDTQSADQTAGDDGTADESDPDPVTGDREPIFADDEGALLDDDLPVDADDEQAADQPFTDASAEEDGTDDSAPEPVVSASARESAPPADAGKPEADGADTGKTGGAGPRDSTNADESPSDSSPGDEPPTTDERTGTTIATGQTETATESASTNESAAEDPLADVSPRTYNRVVRLLQNREFPVDRADFEALATSAYELDHGECSAALDGAIEKGLLVERDGSLHRPE
ncbi:hypothetical protein L593_05805 [Salinarchaeum sp. Harcht-Bsk1]|uniref:hypothetical protein n=1 Tax=Salinarchaeum sp. Harcht-Bsk1 TaxID=1333523 RepID=UPI0003423321|nr:hypothetical protein [Salinarchaeum sp. Harcht-Bsk1]AGN01110.1 hypothetical protein L593_05805 [Salinarchaeum sp. Harcht-Bsk1]